MASIRVRLRSEQTGGALGVVENVAPAGWPGPPLHHHDFDETFYVLDGALEFQLGEDRRTAGPGEVVFAPRGAVHTFANHGTEPARYLLVITPAGFERYFARLGAELAGEDAPAWSRQPYPETTVVGGRLPS